MNRIRAALVLAAALTLTGCAVAGSPPDPAPVTSVDRPLPVNEAEGVPPTSGSAAPAPPCDPTQSLRPSGPLPPAGQMPVGSTMRTIQDRGRLIAGVDQNTYLFGFRDPTTNALEGFDIDRVREIATAIFGNPDAVQYKVITSADRIKALQNGDVDVVVRTFTATCDRLRDINFSAIYYVAGQRLLVNSSSAIKGMTDLGSKKVCAARGSTSLTQLAALTPKPVPVAVDNWSDCLVMLQQGEVEGVSTDDTILSGMVAQDPNVKMVGDRFTAEPYGIGIPKPAEDMVRFVNAVLERSVASHAWADSYNHWLGRTGQSASPPPPNYR